MSETKKIGRFQFTLRSLFILIVGVAIGLALGVAGQSRFPDLRLPSEAQPVLLSPSAIMPPDVLTIELLGESSRDHPGISGEHLVAPDGTVQLGRFGQVTLAGKTIEEARQAIEKHLSKFMESPQVAVDIFSCNSKRYYLIAEEGGRDELLSLPVSGNETVLNAISALKSGTDFSSKNIWIARPQGTSGRVDILRVDWEEITRGGNARSNYQVFPGDRVFVSNNPQPR